MGLTTRAILVGVDGYAFQPLASAVNDAVAMRGALTQPLAGEVQGLVASADVTLLATPAAGQPAPPDSLPATRAAVLGALSPFYVGAETADRLIVYFAGHGRSVSRDGRIREALILPADVALPDDGRNMLCLDELLALFAERGPLQQLWLIDACRDMPCTEPPRGFELEWRGQPPQGPRAQVAIFAVSAGGRALSQQGGHGRFTAHLLDGLRGLGSADDYQPGVGHCVTAQSLHAYAQRHVLDALQGVDDWTRSLQAPELRPRGPLLAPLRRLPTPPARAFQVAVQPEHGRQAIEIALELRGRTVPGWPPLAPPDLYELRASLKPGMDALGWQAPEPALRVVDLREEDHATIVVGWNPPQQRRGAHGLAGPDGPHAYRVTTDASGVAALRSAAPAAPQANSDVAAITTSTAAAATTALLRVEAADAAVRVRLRRVGHPWTLRDNAPANQDLAVEPGAWDVETRLGDQVIGATRVLLAGGRTRVLDSVAQITPLLASLLPPGQAAAAGSPPPATVRPSETIGPMQGAILPTLLPLLALKPLDTQGGLLRQFGHLRIPCVDAGGLPDAAPRCAVAVALEGGPAAMAVPQVAQATCVWAAADGRLSVHLQGTDRGPGRGSVQLRLRGAMVDIAAPRLAGGVTAVAVTAWPDGRVQTSVGLYCWPLGQAWPQPAGDALFLPAGRQARALALAAPLADAGADLRAVQDDSLAEFASGRWLDPVLSAIAFHACRAALARAAAGAATWPAALAGAANEAPAALVERRDSLRDGLAQVFGTLPDSRIIAALHDDPDLQRWAMAALLADPQLGQPLLTASLAALADAARAGGLADHWAVDRIGRIAPGSVFNAVVTADDGSAAPDMPDTRD